MIKEEEFIVIDKNNETQKIQFSFENNLLFVSKKCTKTFILIIYHKIFLKN